MLDAQALAEETSEQESLLLALYPLPHSTTFHTQKSFSTLS